MCTVLVHPSVSSSAQQVMALQQRTGRLVVISPSGGAVKLVPTRQQRNTASTDTGPSAA